MLSTRLLRCSGAAEWQQTKLLSSLFGLWDQAASEEGRGVVTLGSSCSVPVSHQMSLVLHGAPGCAAASASGGEIGAVCGFGV